MFEGSGDEVATTAPPIPDTTSFQAQTRQTYDDDAAWKEYKACWEWTTPRISVEFYAFFVMLENLYLVYIVIVSFKRSERTFFSTCVLIGAFSGIALMLVLLLVPLMFQWLSREDFSKSTETVSESTYNQLDTNGSLIYKFVKVNGDHHCQQSGGQFCRAIGWILSLLVFIPFVSNTMICLNTSMAAFCWKMYKLKVHTISSIRLIVFLCMILAVVISFGLPAVEAGAHYHYNTFLKLCWLPTHLEKNMETRFVFFAFGFLSFILFLLLGFFYLLIQAHRSENSFNKSTGNRCSIIFGIIIMKTKFWSMHSHAAVWITMATIILYLPLTVGIILRFTLIFPRDVLIWFDIIIYASLLLPPAVIPIINLTQFKPYRQTAELTFAGCNKPVKKNRVSPLSFEMNSLDSDDITPGYGHDTWNNTGRSFIVERYRGYPRTTDKGPMIEARHFRNQPFRTLAEESDSGYNDTLQRDYPYSTLESNPDYRRKWRNMDESQAVGNNNPRVPRQNMFDPYNAYNQRPHPARYEQRSRKNIVSRGWPQIYRDGSIPKMVQRYWRNISSSRKSRRRERLSPARDDPLSQPRPRRISAKRNVTFGPTPKHSPLARNPSFPRPGAVKRRVQRLMAQNNFASPSVSRHPIPAPFATGSNRQVERRYDDRMYGDNYGHLYPPTLSRPTGDKLSDESQTSLRGERPTWEVLRNDPIPHGRYASRFH